MRLSDGGGDVILDYRRGTEAWVAGARAALGGLQCAHAVDCVSAHGSWLPLAQLVGPSAGTVSVVSGAHRYDEAEVAASGARIAYTFVGTVHAGAYKPGMPKQPPGEEASGDVGFAERFAVCDPFLHAVVQSLPCLSLVKRYLGLGCFRLAVILRMETDASIFRFGWKGRWRGKKSGAILGSRLMVD